jgi:ATP-dependent Clp protease ATP-binding subunit ClpA
MFGQSLNRLLVATIREVKRRNHEYITVEHLIYAGLFDPIISSILKECGANVSHLKVDLDSYLSEEYEPLPAGIITEPVQTQAFQRVIQSMIAHVQTSGKLHADEGDLLAALFEEDMSYGIYLLKKQGVQRVDILEVISHTDLENLEYEKPAQKSKSKGKSYLEEYAKELVGMAKNQEIDQIIGRESELTRMIQILCRRKKNNPILIGEPGVGKTAIVEGLALKIANNEVPQILQDSKIYALELGSLVAGTKYRGDFEKRLKGIIKEIKKNPKYILFIDEIHTLVGAGAGSNGAMDASNILKPALASGKLKCIGASTFEEYRNHFEKDKALNRRFQKIDVEEPSNEEAFKILKGIISKYENHHGVKYSNAVLKEAVELSSKYITDRFLPDSAIDVIDEVGASFHQLSKPKLNVTKADIQKTISLIAKVPIQTSSMDERMKLKALELDLRHVVFGQDEAIKTLSRAIKRAKAGLSSPNKPLGAFLFSGPTGVGKTEVSKQLAKTLGIHFERFDMSEYMEKHSVSRLIGAPPGYVGFEQAGLLSETIKKFPHTVLLLDEIEKAHEDILNILLQIMDNAVLTDNYGKKINFKNVILIMTSNVGANESNVMGFNSNQQNRSDEAVKNYFSPEFRNRLDAVIHFKPLSIESMQMIVDKFIDEIKIQLEEKKIEIFITKEAKKFLAKEGYSSEFGARPLNRLLQEKLKDPISDEILFGKLSKGGEVSVDFKDNRLKLTFSSKQKSSLEKA